jgi:hypothetical protein
MMEGYWVLADFELCRIKDHAAQVVSDEKYAKRHELFPDDTPSTKEGYFIREIFDGKDSICSFHNLLNKRKGLFTPAAAKTAVRSVHSNSRPDLLSNSAFLDGFRGKTGVAPRIQAEEVLTFTTQPTMPQQHKLLSLHS